MNFAPSHHKEQGHFYDRPSVVKKRGARDRGVSQRETAFCMGMDHGRWFPRGGKLWIVESTLSTIQR